MTLINVVFKAYVPEDWIENLEKDFVHIADKFSKHKDEELFSSFTGPEFIEDITIFLKPGPETIFWAMSYDILKTGLVNLWGKLRQLDIRKISSDKNEPKKKSIKIVYEFDLSKQIEITIEGEWEPKSVEKIVGKALNTLKTGEAQNYFNTPNYVGDIPGLKNKVELQYNSVTKNWEPVDFVEMKRKWDDFIKDIQKRYS